MSNEPACWWWSSLHGQAREMKPGSRGKRQCCNEYVLYLGIKTAANWVIAQEVVNHEWTFATLEMALQPFTLQRKVKLIRFGIGVWLQELCSQIFLLLAIKIKQNNYLTCAPSCLFALVNILWPTRRLLLKLSENNTWIYSWGNSWNQPHPRWPPQQCNL